MRENLSDTFVLELVKFLSFNTMGNEISGTIFWAWIFSLMLPIGKVASD